MKNKIFVLYMFVYILFCISIENVYATSDTNCFYVASINESGVDSMCHEQDDERICSAFSSKQFKSLTVQMDISHIYDYDMSVSDYTFDFDNCPLFIIQNTKYFWGKLLGSLETRIEWGSSMNDFLTKKSLLTNENWGGFFSYYPNEYTTFLLFDEEKLKEITKENEKRYNAISQAVNDFRNYYNYETSWYPHDDGVTQSPSSSGVPPIACPSEFSLYNDLSDKNKYSNKKLEEMIKEADVLTTKLKSIVDSYDSAREYYNDQSLYPLWTLVVGNNYLTDYSLNGLKNYYTIQVINKLQPFESMPNLTRSGLQYKNDYDYYFNKWVSYDYTKYNDIIRIITGNNNMYYSRKFLIQHPDYSKEDSSEQITSFVDECAGDYVELIQNELDTRKKNNAISNEEYNRLNQYLLEVRINMQLLVSSITSMYGKLIDFYGQYGPVDCESILTSEFIEWLKWAYKITEIVAAVLVILLSFIEFMKAIASNDGDALKKSSGKFIKRLIVLAILFLLPILINFILKFVGISGIDNDNPICIDL